MKKIVTDPTKALAALKAGNQRFATQQLRQHSEQARPATQPLAFVLSCMDARVTPQVIFDQALGDLDVARVAGNVVNADIIASIEYSHVAAKTSLLVVLGHTDCAAIAAARDKNSHQCLQSITDKISPALAQAATEKDVATNNARLQAQNVLAGSQALTQLVLADEFTIAAALYDVDLLEVSFIDEDIRPH